MLHVMISVAIVMPEIGLDELPMSPVMRDDTVTKKNANTTIRKAATKFHCIGMPGVTRQEQRDQQRADQHDRQMGMSRSVRSCAAGARRPRRSRGRSRGTRR